MLKPKHVQKRSSMPIKIPQSQFISQTSHSIHLFTRIKGLNEFLWAASSTKILPNTPESIAEIQFVGLRSFSIWIDIFLGTDIFLGCLKCLTIIGASEFGQFSVRTFWIVFLGVSSGLNKSAFWSKLLLEIPLLILVLWIFVFKLIFTALTLMISVPIKSVG